MTISELTNRRPSVLSGVFRRHSEPNGARLRDWTRCVDGDWRWYCPECGEIVLLIEEKLESAAQRGWSVTQRLAARHADRPHAWRVTCHESGEFTVDGLDGVRRYGPRRLSEDELIETIELRFRAHYERHAA